MARTVCTLLLLGTVLLPGELLATVIYPSSDPETEGTEAPARGTYGDFTIVGNRIVNGIFDPRPEPAYPPLPGVRHHIVINYTKKTLEYYRVTDEGPVGNFGRPVVTPAPEALRGRVVYGRVRKINMEPTWCITKNIGDAYPDLKEALKAIDHSAYEGLAENCFPFGHSKNAMGVAKFEIDWEVSGWEAIRLHGTPGYPVDFVDEETFGCTRLLNPEILKLIERIGGPDAVNEGISIVVSA